MGALISQASARGTNHFGRLRSSYVELHVGVLLPVTKQEGESLKETIECIAEGGQSLGARVAVQASLEGLAGLDQGFPGLEVIGIGLLKRETDQNMIPRPRLDEVDTYHLGMELAHSRILLVRASELAEVTHGCRVQDAFLWSTRMEPGNQTRSFPRFARAKGGPRTRLLRVREVGGGGKWMGQV